jgi:hypothetical protein
MLAPEGCV